MPGARKETLRNRLEVRTSLFHKVGRSPAAIAEFERAILDREGTESLDGDIHVCRFVGFLDPYCHTVGCLLHPSAHGNDGKDLRGLCYYGSLACETFFCNAWDHLPQTYQEIIADLIDDWHLWGLVVTDTDFVLSLFGLLESAIDGSIDPLRLRTGLPRDTLRSMLRWKNEWPFAENSAQRFSRYYHGGSNDVTAGADHKMRIMVQCLDHTYGTKTDFGDAAAMILAAVKRFAASYSWDTKCP